MNYTEGSGEADGMDRAVTDALRTALMAAARAGEQLARWYGQQQRQIQRREHLQLRELRSRFTASRAAARGQLAPVARADWWNAAGPEMIAQVHQTATAWRGLDPKAAASAERIRAEVRQRYSIDVPDPARGPGGMAARVEEITAGAVLAGVNRADHAPAAEPAYDSEERRRQLVEELAGHPDREAAAARLLADQHQGTPPGAAVESRPRVVRPTRNAPAPKRVRGVERGGAER